MDSLIVAINSILPVCLLIGIGYIIQAKKILSQKAIKEMNRLVFTLFLPVLLMKNMMNTNLEQAFQPKLLVYCTGFLIVVVLASMLAIPFFEKDNTKQGVIVQALFRTNFVLLGLPLVKSIMPNTDMGVTAIVVAIIVPIFNVMAVIVLQYYSGKKINLKTTFIGIAKNPMIIGSFVGLVILLLRVDVPTPFLSVINDVSNCANPIAIIVLGASFHIQSVKNNINALSLITLFRLIIIPIIGIGGAIVLGYRGVELATMLVLFGGPVAVSSFAMAESMGQDGELASQVVLITTLTCVFSLFIWIFLLNNAGMLV